MNFKILSLIILIFVFQQNFASVKFEQTKQDTTINSDDEFEDYNEGADSQATSSDDEFEDYNEETVNNAINSDDEFKDVDEFEEFSETEKTVSQSCPSGGCSSCKKNSESFLNSALIWVLGILAITILAGFFVRFEKTRKFRNIFLISSLIVLGFSELHHACPCMISSIQDTFLWIFGNDVDWRKMIWFLGLLPITYIFGQVWCGWLCHLGALQEFLYLPGKIKIFRGEKAQKTMKIIRWVLFIVLLIQLFAESRIFYCKIDPFKAIFDLGFLGSKYLVTRWILVGLLILSSLFIYRPFCKTVCPVGLMLGLISKIPGAAVIGIGGKCVGCNVCNKACDMDAITHHGKFSIIDNSECIMCGDCMDSCKQHGLSIFRKNKKHPDKIECKKDECKL